MSLHLGKIKRKIDAMPVRSRILLLSAAASLIVYGAQIIIFEPGQKKIKDLEGKIEAQETENQTIELDLTEAEAKQKILSVDPNIAKKKALLRKNRELTYLLSRVKNKMVSPQEMASLLHGMLENTESLKLVSLKNLEHTQIKEEPKEKNNDKRKEKADENQKDKIEKPEEAVEDKSDLFYLHGIELTIEGTYFEVVDFLRSIEALPWQLYWESLEYKVEGYPNGTVVITLFSLNKEGYWLSI